MSKGEYYEYKPICFLVEVMERGELEAGGDDNYEDSGILDPI